MTGPPGVKGVGERINVEVRQLSSEGLETARPLTRKLRVAWLWICLQCLQVGSGGHEACCFPLAVWQPTVHTPHSQSRPSLPLQGLRSCLALYFLMAFPCPYRLPLPSCTLSPTLTCSHYTPLVPGHHLCRMPHLHPCWEF